MQAETLTPIRSLAEQLGSGVCRRAAKLLPLLGDGAAASAGAMLAQSSVRLKQARWRVVMWWPLRDVVL